jgi:hypothetical protein
MGYQPVSFEPADTTAMTGWGARMTDRTQRRDASGGTVAEARSATALFLSLTAVIAAAIALACLTDGQSGVGIATGLVAAASFVVSLICFSADAEPLAAPEQAPAGLATAD